MGKRGGSGRTETAVNESRREKTDRVARYQTDYVVGRTCILYATRTTNCCGCLEGVFVDLRFSCPFLSLLVVFYICCPRIVLFCLSHLRGGTTPLFLFYGFCTWYCFFCFFSLSLSFFSLSTHPDCYVAFVSYPVRWLHCVVCSAYCITM